MCSNLYQNWDENYDSVSVLYVINIIIIIIIIIIMFMKVQACFLFLDPQDEFGPSISS